MTKVYTSKKGAVVTEKHIKQMDAMFDEEPTSATIKRKVRAFLRTV